MGAIFKHFLNATETELALKNVKRSVRGNPVPVRLTYWYHVYQQVLTSRNVFVFQNNNIPANTLKKLRLDLSDLGIEMLNVRNGVFRAACKQDNQGLMNLFQGQSMVWFSNTTDNDNPKFLLDLYKVSNKYKQHLFLVGGKMDDMVLTLDGFDHVKTLPNKTQLLGQLLGLLQYPAGQLTATLSSTPQLLAASLDQHVKQQQ